MSSCRKAWFHNSYDGIIKEYLDSLVFIDDAADKESLRLLQKWLQCEEGCEVLLTVQERIANVKS